METKRKKARMGRPLKEETRLSHNVKVRLSDAAFNELERYCEAAGAERAEVKVCVNSKNLQ